MTELDLDAIEGRELFIAQVLPLAEIIRRFSCPGLLTEQPDSIVACYRAGHECRSTYERLEDEHGVFSRSFCACCGQSYGSIFQTWAMVRQSRAADPTQEDT